ncbi:MAG: SPOR domain-containing protein [Gammaproteobacteria bacterium]|nr:SPOR domain-containing protein [Gammaproteobacteria bacterium]
MLEGYDAFTTEHPDENALARFRVIVGPYETRQASNEDVARLRQRNVSAFLVPLTENSP